MDPTNPQRHLPALGSVPAALAAKLELEKIFKDLYLGVQFEAALGLRTLSSSDLEVVITRESSLNRLLEVRGVALIDSLATAELAEASAALNCASWLEKHESLDDSDLGLMLSQSMGSHTHIFDSSHRGNTLHTTRINDGPVITNELVTQTLKRSRRYLQCVKSIGWTLFSLLALSPSFRHAPSQLGPATWDHLHRLIKENKGSFKIIANTVRPKHGALLLKMLQDPYIRRTLGSPSQSSAIQVSMAWANNFTALMSTHKSPGDFSDPMAARHLMHPHRWCLKSNKQDARPISTPYIPVEHSVLGPGFTADNDPRYINTSSREVAGPEDTRGDSCEMCKSTGAEHCGVMPKHFRPPVVELFETENRGIGVRSLQRITKNAVLAEYAGVITKSVAYEDNYVLSGPNNQRDANWYLITSIYQGNFTRFVNHSCNPNTVLASKVIANKEISILFTTRDISLFEEITTDYGQGHFIQRGMKCLCGTPQCKIGPDSS